MSVLIGLCGFAGVGKSTAIDFIKARRGGESVYLGAVVLEEVRRRGLPETRESEREVRLDLRRTDNAALAKARAGMIVSRLASGHPVMIDAVVVMEEFEFLRTLVGVDRFHLLEIRAPLDHRCERLALRTERSFTREELLARDGTERERLGVDEVFAQATRRILNDGSVAEFEARLDAFLDEVFPQSGG